MIWKKKTKIIAVLIISTFIAYFVFILVKADNPVGKYVSVKGGEIERVEDGHWATYQDQIGDLNLAWARIHIRWYALDEDGSGGFDFSSNPEYISFRDAVMIADSMGAKVIVTIKGAPGQLIEPTPIATAPNGAPTPWPFPCGRISTPQGTDRLKLFTVALLQQLHSDFGLGPTDPPPVEYIEIWNEPDAPAYDAVPDYFGCWVKKQNGIPEYQDGGIYYAQVLNEVAPYVKSQFPIGSVKFVAGATMNSTNGFLEKVVDHAITNIDVVSYHQYVHITNSSDCDLAAYISNYDSSFMHIRNYLDNHGGAEKHIMISEGAMGFYPVPSQTPAPAFYDCQARFAASLLTWAKGKESNGKLLGFIWYTISPHFWRDTSLMYYPSGTPKPVYYIWRDFGPAVYLPLVFSNIPGGSQSSSMNGVPSAKPGDPYPPPLGDPSGEYDKLVNPYPAPEN